MHSMTGLHTGELPTICLGVHAYTRWNLCAEDCLLLGNRSYFPNDTRNRLGGEIQKRVISAYMPTAGHHPGPTYPRVSHGVN